MSSRITKMTLLPDVESHGLFQTVRNLQSICVSITDFAGSTPEPAGDRPTILLRDSIPERLVPSVRAALADLATVDLMNEF
jgi:hypothetical protein